MKYIAFHDNGLTRGVEVGRFGGMFYAHVYYGIVANFRLHVHAQVMYPRFIRSWVV